MSTASVSTRQLPGKASSSNNLDRESGKSITQRRTTVALSPRAAEIVQQFQDAAGISLSEAVSELIERSDEQPARIKFVDGIPTADVPLTGKWISNEDVIRAQAELG